MTGGPTGREQAVTSFAPDQAVAEWFLGRAVAHPGLVEVGEVLAVALHPWVFRVAVAGAGVLAWRAGHRRAAVVATATMAVGGLVGVGLKLLVARPRPAWANPVASEIGYSMPSGHALNAALGTTLLVLLARPWLRGRRGALAAGAAASVTLVAAADRLVLGVHYLTDVLVGVGLGTGLALAAGYVLSRGHRRPGRG